MSNRTRCSQLTTRGRPCRNPAALGTEPPACARHRDKAAGDATAPLTGPIAPTTRERAAPAPRERATPAPRHFYFPNPTADELRALEAGGGEADLRPEVALVRVVLRRLLAYLDEAAAELPPDELRRVSGLVFTGARTVAHLLAQRAARPDDMQNWLEGALAALSADHAVDL